jgi:hypothetical protein
MPRFAGGGVAQSALRSYVHTLHAELGPEGVYAGALLIGALIEGSEALGSRRGLGTAGRGGGQTTCNHRLHFAS